MHHARLALTLYIIVAASVLTPLGAGAPQTTPAGSPSLYLTLLSKFPEEAQGVGPEPSFPGSKHQPMTYGLLLSAESLRYRALPTPEGRGRILDAARWLVSNQDLDADGKPGWGLPDEWDAFGDGTKNPAHHPYSITTALVMAGLMDSLELRDLWSPAETAATVELLRAVVLRWTQEGYYVTASGKFFAYSPYDHDSYYAPNVSAMFLGIAQRFLKRYGSYVAPFSRAKIQAAVDASAASIVEKNMPRSRLPYWHYITMPNSLNQREPNDLVHHTYIVWGMEEYRTNGGNVPLPWSVQEALDSVSHFVRAGKIHDYPQDVTYVGTQASYQDRPARLWGAGMLAAFVGRFAGSDAARALITRIHGDYGFPDLLMFPSSFSPDRRFYPRQAVHVLLGMARSELGIRR